MSPRRLIGLGALAISTAMGAASALAGEQWYVPGDFATIQEAIDSPLVVSGDSIRVGPGEHAGATVTKGVEIRGEGGPVISDGPAHGSGMKQGFRLLAGGDGATFSHLSFTVDLPIMNGEAADDVTVTHCDFENAVQAVSNWRGSGWEITHNTIHDLRTRCGGGIGILVGDYGAGTIMDNLVAHNKITGTLHVSQGDCGGYSGTGIVVYADFRFGRVGTQSIAFNRVIKNHVALTSDNPAVVDVVAFELTDTRNDPAQLVLTDNTVAFNQWSDMTNQISLTPAELDGVNAISRNLGDNRGHGMHPGSLFGPHD